MAETDGVAPSCDCNYGVLPNVQLHVQPGMAIHEAKGAPLQCGPDHTEFGVKYRFIEQDKAGWVLSVGHLPVARGAHGRCGARSRYWQDPPLWVQKDFGDWTTYGGGGYWINPGPGNKNFWFAGWVLERKITDKLTLGVALFHQTPDAISGVSATGFNFGSVPSTGFMRNLRFHRSLSFPFFV